MNGITTRRTFLRQGSAAAGLVLGSRAGLRPGSRPTGAPFPMARGRGTPGPRIEPALRIETDPAVKALALRAIDAARSAGATYADVRLTRTLTRYAVHDTEDYAVGVRALVGGAWGFAASPYWTPEEVTQLAQDATAQAKANAAGVVRPMELGPPVVTTGSWIMPVRVDPFTVPIEEMQELEQAWADRAGRIGRNLGRYETTGGVFDPNFFTRQEQAVASSEGSYFTQTTWRSSFGFYFNYGLFFRAHGPMGASEGMNANTGATGAPGLGYQAAGWEAVLDARLDEQLPGFLAAARRQATAPATPPRETPGEVGRYDVVFDAGTMASLVEGSLAGATQLDRALGYEANAGGTSYVTDPLGMVGSFQIGAPLLTLTTDRSRPKSLAWVKWDDEGVAPDTATLVQDGVLTDFQTTREGAGWLAEYYAKTGKPVRSHGCAYAPTASAVPLPHAPNLTLRPALDTVSFADLVRDTKQGIAVMGDSFSFDFQGVTGLGGRSPLRVIREIKNGRLGARLRVMVPYVNTRELWQHLQALGGPQSAISVGVKATKGEPAQTSWHTVTTVPAKFTNVAFLDPARRG